MNSTIRLLLAMLACIITGSLVTACGFHLRGSNVDTQASTGSAFTVLTEGDDVYDLFYPALHRELEKNKLLPDGTTAADFIIHVGVESPKTRILTVNTTSGRSADTEITMSVPIMIYRNGNAVAINKVSATRVYLFDTNAQLFSDRQAEALKVEMRNEISQRIVEQLRVLYRNPKPAAPEPAPVATNPDTAAATPAQ